MELKGAPAVSMAWHHDDAGKWILPLQMRTGSKLAPADEDWIHLGTYPLGIYIYIYF
jgi:hypothetical protein